VDALGDKLREAREEKGCSYEQVSLETNIAVRYLEALEKEDFGVFPGEAYLLGFLRNYGDYLGLDTDGLFANYRAAKIQEQPIPVEQLLHSPSPLPRIIRNVAVIAGIAVAGGFGVFFFQKYQSRRTAAGPVEPRVPAAWTMDTPFVERRFYRGDSITIPLESNLYKIEIAELGEAVSLSTPAGQSLLDLGQEVSVDLTRDGSGDILITAVDFSKTNSGAGVLLRLDLEYVDPVVSIPAPETGPADNGAEPAASPAGAESVPAIFNSPNPYPFTLQIMFQGFCMFRWEILGERDRRDRNERYFSRGEELSIPAQNGIRMWISNAQAGRMQVIGGGRTVALETGGAGEVVVADVRWVRDEGGRYRLVLLRLE
jgi:transcriptional regulator with XRE-family HTH domain